MLTAASPPPVQPTAQRPHPPTRPSFMPVSSAAAPDTSRPATQRAMSVGGPSPREHTPHTLHTPKVWFSNAVSCTLFGAAIRARCIAVSQYVPWARWPLRSALCVTVSLTKPYEAGSQRVSRADGRHLCAPTTGVKLNKRMVQGNSTTCDPYTPNFTV